MVHGFTFALPTGPRDNISERGRGLGHVTPRIFGIPSSISPKPVECSKLAHSFALSIPTGPKYNIYERGRGLGHVTPKKFGILWTIARKPIKLEISNFVHGFALVISTKRKL